MSLSDLDLLFHCVAAHVVERLDQFREVLGLWVSPREPLLPLEDFVVLVGRRLVAEKRHESVTAAACQMPKNNNLVLQKQNNNNNILLPHLMYFVRYVIRSFREPAHSHTDKFKKR